MMNILTKKIIKKNREKRRNQFDQDFKNDIIRQELSSSQNEFEGRIDEETCLLHYRYLLNQFRSLSDDDLIACMKSYFAVCRGIGPNNPILVEKLNLYVNKWEEYMSIADPASTKTERQKHAVKTCYIDLLKEAACRFVMAKEQEKSNEHNYKESK